VLPSVVVLLVLVALGQMAMVCPSGALAASLVLVLVLPMKKMVRSMHHVLPVLRLLLVPFEVAEVYLALRCVLAFVGHILLLEPWLLVDFAVLMLLLSVLRLWPFVLVG
jgi:hypothetical protein